MRKTRAWRQSEIWACADPKHCQQGPEFGLPPGWPSPRVQETRPRGLALRRVTPGRGQGRSPRRQMELRHYPQLQSFTAPAGWGPGQKREELTFTEFTSATCLPFSTLWHHTVWIQILIPPYICCVALGKFLNLSVPKSHPL